MSDSTVVDDEVDDADVDVDDFEAVDIDDVREGEDGDSGVVSDV